jgi:hypothetical protein
MKNPFTGNESRKRGETPHRDVTRRRGKARPRYQNRHPGQGLRTAAAVAAVRE